MHSNDINQQERAEYQTVHWASTWIRDREERKRLGMHGSHSGWMNLFLQDKFNSTTKGKSRSIRGRGKKKLVFTEANCKNQLFLSVHYYLQTLVLNLLDAM